MTRIEISDRLAIRMERMDFILEILSLVPHAGGQRTVAPPRRILSFWYGFA
jgi:hypothetical protein